MFGRPAALRALGLAACAAAPLLTAGVAQASVITFTDRSLFEAALSSFTTFDFNASALEPLDMGDRLGDFKPSQPIKSGGGASLYRKSTAAASPVMSNGTNSSDYI